jgi:uncharacterized protein YjhX (UPF0386 family)
MAIYRHSLNKVLISALKKLNQYGVARLSAIGLTHVEINNFSKLKYWGLVAKCHGNEWKITQLGRDFLEGREWLYRQALTYNDKVVNYEGELVCVNTVTFELMTKDEFAKNRITITIPKQPDYSGKLF